MGQLKRRTWVLEYSNEQKVLHIQPLSQAIRANQRMFVHQSNYMPDFLPIFIGSKRACERMARIAEANIRIDRETATWTH
jgi:hypothetical protein